MASGTDDGAVRSSLSQLPPGLPAGALYRQANLSRLSFATSADLEPLRGMEAQERADAAIRFGTGIAARGFNIFAIGQTGARIAEAIRPLLDEAASHRTPPSDWVYVYNFAAPHQPMAIALPSGRAPALDAAAAEMIDDLRAALPATLESEEFQRRRSAVEARFHGEAERAFESLGEKASELGVAIIRTPMGFAVAPLKDGKVVPPEDFNAWPAERQQAVRGVVEQIEKELETTLRAVPRIEKERRDAIRALQRETAMVVIDQAVSEASAPFADLPRVVAHFDAVRADLLENFALFLDGENDKAEPLPAGLRMGSPFDRYDVNVLVTQPEGSGERAPVVEELHPTLSNLLGRIEHLPVQGALVTNFRMVRAGSLHRANGGTLVIDARALLTEPFSWAALKRALAQERIVIEDVARFVGLTTTVSLEPEPIPLDCKVVLVGDRLLYHLLAAFDPELERHFKVLADFDDAIERTPENEALLARLVATLARREEVPPLAQGAVLRVVEQASRLAEDSARLTLLHEALRDLVVEGAHLAKRAGRDLVSRDDIEQAIAAQRHRGSRLRELSQEAMRRGIALIDTSGSRIGQVNGLSVVALGSQGFGRPSRITARVRPGSGRIIDIEREVELGGPMHSKGVLILAGFIAGRYALQAPIALHASLVFEQSYGGVEGDSASAAELVALLSALAELPVRQDLAITGSVNQHGDIQAIGGVNDKIEGFFELCAARGLTGTQGVLVPESNVQHLMLDREVVAACEAGRFAVHAVRGIDEATSLLLGREAGVRGPDGAFPEGGINALVERRLGAFAEQRRAMLGGDGERREAYP
ncbi:ATP-dependent protease [Falsiroseomonas bella]|uniref:endopeptidase La n=1 Tax=Falsiroseomonas bella TaxID=2184016 RepID=A0A317FED7_9PROT|nr:ATP-binding protein [Falsiroseomonas bella]PWS35948.1 ATP-dependent protease [Falsiroseomonas bella]